MNILFVSSEVEPFSKSGGLADVAGSLPKSLQEMGIKVSICTPFYKGIDKKHYHLRNLGPIGKDISLDGQKIRASFLQGRLNLEKEDSGYEIPVYFLDYPPYFIRDFYYAEGSQDYSDNHLRFAYFCLAALELSRSLGNPFDIIHINDWQTSLLPLYQNIFYPDCQAKTLLTIHNLAFQGLFDSSHLKALNVSEQYFNIRQLEYYGKINFLKTGIVFSNAITTVSPHYAEEILSEEYGCGLHGVLAEKANVVSGILNGVDYSVWNPGKDKFISANYDSSNLKGKKRCKAALQKLFSLPRKADTPLIGVISRLTPQKGLELLIDFTQQWLELDCQFIFLGTGDKNIEDHLEKIAQNNRHKIAVKIGFENALAHKIEAGSDIFLMPSRYEPCGLNQIYSLKYGTVPIVRNTGGLVDTVDEWDEESKCGTGFKFYPYSAIRMIATIKKALSIYQDKKSWQKIMLAGMKKDFSWGKSAKEYNNLYQSLI